MEKRSEEMQTLRAGCSKAEPKIFARPQTPTHKLSHTQTNTQTGPITIHCAAASAQCNDE